MQRTGESSNVSLLVFLIISHAFNVSKLIEELECHGLWPTPHT